MPPTTRLQLYVSMKLQDRGSNIRVLASKMGISHGSLYNYLKQASIPDNVLHSIALNLNVDVEELRSRVGRLVEA